jgi:hypothetical protein
MNVVRESGIPGLCDLLLVNSREFSKQRHHRPEHNSPALSISAGVFAVLAAVIFGVCTAQNMGSPCADTLANIVAGLLWVMAASIMFSQFFLAAA